MINPNFKKPDVATFIIVNNILWIAAYVSVNRDNFAIVKKANFLIDILNRNDVIDEFDRLALSTMFKFDN